jgi:tetratricopeptide (TPR) repeat protein
VACIIFVTLVVYVLGACPTIYVGDSGELVAAVHLLGIPHPSGYPLYVLLGKLWTLLLPVGSIAYRMSVFSSVSAAAACGLLYLACRAVPMTRLASAAAALTLGFSESFWAEANVQRVYALNALFVALAMWLTIRWYHTRDRRTVWLVFMCCGVGAANHTVMAVCGIGVLVFMMAIDRSLLRQTRILAGAAAAFALGLTPYLYLPLRSRMNPALDWGNPETARSLLAVMLRTDFWSRRWYEQPSDLLVAGADYVSSFRLELGWPALTLAVVGASSAFSRRRERKRIPELLLLPALIMAANFVIVAIHGSRSDIFIWHRYYLPSYIALAWIVGLGCHEVLRFIPRRASAVVLIVPALLVIGGFRGHDRSRYRVAEDFSRALLNQVPPGGRIIASDDNILFVLIYLHFVEGVRPDVDLILEGVGGADLPPVRFDPDIDPLSLTHMPSWRVEGLDVVPVGLVFRTVRAGGPRPAVAAAEPFLAGELDASVPKDYLTSNLIGHFHYMRGVTAQNRDWAEARREFDRARAAAPDNDVLFYNLGLIFRDQGLLPEAIAAFRRSDAINPREIPGSRGPLASEQAAMLIPELTRISQIESDLVAHPDLTGLDSGSADFHERLAALFRARGEAGAARGEQLRALERAAGLPSPM